MRLTRAMPLLAFLAILGGGLYLGRHSTHGHGATPAPVAAGANEPPARSTLLEKGDWYLAHGDLDRAGEMFEQAMEFPLSLGAAKAGLRAVSRRKRDACLGDAAKLANLMAWLDRHDLGPEAELLAERIVILHPKNAEAHRRLGHEEYEGEWYGQDLNDLARAARDREQRERDWSRMTPRSRTVFAAKEELRRAFESDPLFMDCGPGAPWMIAIEPSREYAASKRLMDCRSVLSALYGEFVRLFPGFFDPIELPREEVLVVYAFNGADRYRWLTDAWPLDRGHFEHGSRRACLVADREISPEQLLHAATRQMIDCLMRLRGRGDEIEAGRLAIWIDSGLACRNEAFRYGADGAYSFEGPSKRHLEPAQKALLAQKRPVTLRDVVGFRQADLQKARAKPGGSARMNALCWSAVYFFMDGAGGKRRKDFLRYCEDEWKSGVGIEGAENRLGKLDALDHEWKEFVLGLK